MLGSASLVSRSSRALLLSAIGAAFIALVATAAPAFA
jgi:hypothetical protein